MPHPLKICFVASEIWPLAKTGGLADVAGALGRYLHRAGHDIRLFMPNYASVGSLRIPRQPVPDIQSIPLEFGAHRYTFSLLESVIPGTAVPVYLVDCPALYDRNTLYTPGPDEHLRFLMLQRAALETCQRLRFAPDILHCHDWHTALLPLLLRTHYAWDRLFAGTRTLLTLHNIGYQGVFPLATAADINLPPDSTWLDAGERLAGRINWLRQGIVLADEVSTVSPTYAREIATPAGGYGVDDALRARSSPVVGILNGVDYSEWNPQTDPTLPHPYSAANLSGKARTKRHLLGILQLPMDPALPLAGIISRLAMQKGFDLLFDTLPDLLARRPFGLVVLGSGEARYETFFSGLQARFPGRVVFHRGYDEELAHAIEAGADIFLMPSLYEPCGLNQMYSLKYGTVPVVRRTGGLADSVSHWDPATGSGTGIVFNDFDAPAMRWAIETALDLYADPAAWRRMMLNGMACDYSWDIQGMEYLRLYAAMTGSDPAEVASMRPATRPAPISAAS